MSYAIRKDGLGWRAVNDASECTDDETWQEEQPEIIQAVEILDPVEKLKKFLELNHDVREFLK